jgi:hypothetical protein
MSTIRFNTVIGEDRTIRPPEGVRLTPGKAEIIVVQAPDGAAGSSEEEAPAAGVPEVAGELARFAREQGVGDLPTDFALNHDHYLHGAPKGIDQS